MKRLQEYIVENIVNIFEAHMNGDKSYKHFNKTSEPYGYAKTLLRYLLDDAENNSNFSVKIFYDKKNAKGINLSNSDLFFELKPNNVDQKKIGNILDKLNQNTKEEEFYKYDTFCKDLWEALNLETLNSEIKNKLSKLTILKNGYVDIFSHIDKTSFTKLVSTRDQEVTTCLLWNYLVENKKLETFINTEYNKLDIDEYINNSTLDNNNEHYEINIKGFDPSWKKSFYYQIQSIYNFLNLYEKISGNINDFRMERYDGDDLIKNWNISKKYANVIKEYTSKLKNFGGSKDNWDPTDVILYNSKYISTLDSYFNSLQSLAKKINVSSYHNIDEIVDSGYRNFRMNFLRLYMDNKDDEQDIRNNIQEGNFFGLSLKKLSNKSNIEYFNFPAYDADNNVKISGIDISNEIAKELQEDNDKFINGIKILKEIENINSDKKIIQLYSHDPDKSPNTLYIILNCKMPYNILQRASTDVEKMNFVEGSSIKNIRLTLRTFGESIGIDISICKSNKNSKYTNQGSISLGKCSTKIWTKILNVNTNNTKNTPENVKLCINNFIKLLESINNKKDNNTNIINNIKLMIDSALKCGPACLPFMLLH